ncbi:MAG: hypothetical protein K6G88_11205 [Lachnospiraceae bacterium]|nr:hypothetical protein [Lachnospiraceae bacterium]
MKEFVLKLENISDSYYDFVVAVLTYVKKKSVRYDKVNDYLENNPNALTSDVLAFISEQDDFYEDAAYVEQQRVV